MQGETQDRRRAEFPCEWACGICAAVCGPRAIYYVPGAVTVDCDVCTGCGDCATVCPHGVLKEEEVARL